MNLLTVLPALTEDERFVLTNMLATYGQQTHLNDANDHIGRKCRDLIKLGLTDRELAITCAKRHLANIHHGEAPYVHLAPKFADLLRKLEQQ